MKEKPTPSLNLRLENAPGFRLKRFLTVILGEPFVEKVIDPLHAESLHLYCERLDRGEEFSAWLVKWRLRGWMLWSAFHPLIRWCVTLFTERFLTLK